MEKTKKTPEEIVDENRPLFVGDLILKSANTKLEVVTSMSICKLIYSACTEIYMKYSNHKEKYPSFNNFSIGDYDIFGEDSFITINAFEREFIIKITKMPEEYLKLKGVSDISLEIKIEDNMVCAGISFAKTKTTVYEISPITIPYAFLDATESVISPANNSNFKDLHDTIFGFNLIMNITCSGTSVCDDSDIFCYEDGFRIAYKKALKQKIDLDIKNQKSAIDEYNNKINKYNKLIISSKRTIRRCNRSRNKIYHELND